MEKSCGTCRHWRPLSEQSLLQGGRRHYRTWQRGRRIIWGRCRAWKSDTESLYGCRCWEEKG